MRKQAFALQRAFEIMGGLCPRWRWRDMIPICDFFIALVQQKTVCCMPGGLHSDVGILAQELECSLEFCHSDALLSVLSHGDMGDIDLIENYKLSFVKMNIYTEYTQINDYFH